MLMFIHFILFFFACFKNRELLWTCSSVWYCTRGNLLQLVHCKILLRRLWLETMLSVAALIQGILENKIFKNTSIFFAPFLKWFTLKSLLKKSNDFEALCLTSLIQNSNYPLNELLIFINDLMLGEEISKTVKVLFLMYTNWKWTEINLSSEQS